MRASAGAAALVAGSRPAAAHVDYVTDSNQVVEALGFLLEVLSDPFNAALLGGGALTAVVLAATYLRYRPARRDVAVFRAAMDDYRDLLPWLLRLSFGLPLVGAGFGGYFFSPAVEPLVGGLVTRLFTIGMGFCLLFGLATRVVAFVTLVVYLVSVPFAPQLLLANEYVPGMAALVLVGSGRPSADQVLNRVASAEGTIYGQLDPVHRAADAVERAVTPYRPYVPTVVRVGLGVDFVFLGLYEKLLQPGAALAVVEKYDLTAVVPVDPGLWVVGAGLTEISLGLMLTAGLFVRADATVALAMFTLTLFGLPDDPVLAHVSLFGLASALLITGAGPLSLDRRLAATTDDRAAEAPGAPGD
ncbi:MAG: DoxX family protein [Haloglomus sp.]